MKCDECRYVRFKKGRAICGHPDKEYIEKYRKEHKMNSMLGFIGKFKDTVPEWCPEKKMRTN